MELLQCISYVAFIGFASHFIGQLLPREWFNPDRFPYRCFAWEDRGKIYHKLNIRAWKDRLPDASQHVRDMYRKQVNTHADEENLHRMIEETCVAEFIHKLLIVFSLGVIEIWDGKNGWICWFLCLLGNLPFILIQRFNRPRLQAVLKRLKDRKVAP